MKHLRTILAAFALVAVASGGPAMAAKDNNLGSFIITTDKSAAELAALVEKVCSDAGVTGCKVVKLHGDTYRLDLPPGVIDTFTEDARSGEDRFAAVSRQLKIMLGNKTEVSINKPVGLY